MSEQKSIKSDLRIYLLLFFIFGSLFPTFRVLVIGTETSQSLFEYFISSLVDLAAISIIIYSFYYIYKNNQLKKFTYFDWIVTGFILSNVLIGTLLSGDLKISAYGFRMTYLPSLFYFVLRFTDFEKLRRIRLFNEVFSWFFIVAVIGIILYFGFYDLMVSMIYYVGGIVSKYFITRMTSIFWTPVLFATFCTMTFMYFYYRLLAYGNWKNYIVLGILWISILMSVTRGAFVVHIIGLLSLAFLSGKWKRFSIEEIVNNRFW